MQINGLDHVAFRCRDAEETRLFYEELLGLPLVAVSSGEACVRHDGAADVLQLQFALSDGGRLSFIDAPATARPDQFAPTDGTERHVALSLASAEALLALKQLLDEHDIPCGDPVTAAGAISLSLWDPNGLQLELVAPLLPRPAAGAGAAARDHLARWSEQTRARKAWLFPVKA